MDHDGYHDAYVCGILVGMRTVAIVGASANEARPSHGIMKFLIEAGFDVFAVNPRLAGKRLLGRPAYARLADIPVPIDMVDIFRRQDAVPAIVAETLALASLPKAVWMQLGIRHDAAAAEAEAVGIEVVMNRCVKREHDRLCGEIASRSGCFPSCLNDSQDIS